MINVILKISQYDGFRFVWLGYQILFSCFLQFVVPSRYCTLKRDQVLSFVSLPSENDLSAFTYTLKCPLHVQSPNVSV